MQVRTALGLINRVLGEVLAQQEGDFAADTRWCVEWFKRFGFDSGPYDTADLLSKAKNTAVGGLKYAGVLKAQAGKVTLLSLGAMPDDYDPAHDDRLSEWKICLHLAKRLRTKGGDPAAQLMAVARDNVNLDTVKELAYLLYSIADKNGWPEIAHVFNGLGTSWSELDARSRRPEVAERSHVQRRLGLQPDR